MSISFERKIPKKRMTIKRNPYIVILNEKQEGAIWPNKKLSHKQVRSRNKKLIKEEVEE